MKEKIYQLLEDLNIEMDHKLIAGDLTTYVEKIIERSTIISIHNNENLHGFISYYDNDEKKEAAFLTMIAIGKTFRHLGYGRGLLEFSILNLRRLGFTKYGLEVLKENLIAVAMYKKTGFVVKKENSLHYFMEILL